MGITWEQFDELIASRTHSRRLTMPIAPSSYFLHKAQRADHYEQKRTDSVQSKDVFCVALCGLIPDSNDCVSKGGTLCLFE